MKKTYKQVLFLSFLVIQCVVLAVCLLHITRFLQDDRHIDVGLSSWSSESAVWDGTSWQWNGSDRRSAPLVTGGPSWTWSDGSESREGMSVLQGPFVHLDAGSYSVRIDYDTDDDQLAEVYSERTDNGKFFNKYNRKTWLSHNQRFVISRFELKRPVDDFELRVYFNGNGSFKIRNIVLSRNSVWLRKALFMLFSVFLAFDVLFLLRRKIVRHKMECVCLAGIALLCSLPVSVTGLFYGHDLSFHLSRIQGLAEELLRGHFPVRIQSHWYYGYGYPVSIYYGDFLLYFPAVIKACGFSLSTALKVYILVVNFLTAFISYICFRKMFDNKKIGMLVTLAFCTSTYRLMNIYVRSAVGEYSAVMFMPVVALAVFRIYTERGSIRTGINDAVLLGASMAGMLCTHILSTEMVCLVLAGIGLVLFKRTFTRRVLALYGIAIAVALFLSAGFLVPFLDYFKSMDVVVNINRGGRRMQSRGAYLIQLFSLFSRVSGGGIEPEIRDRMALTPGLALMTVFFYACYKICKNLKPFCRYPVMTFLTAVSAVLLLMSTNIFPWNYVHLLPFGRALNNILSQVQFPWRYIGMAVVILSMLTGVVVVECTDLMKRNRLVTIFVATSLFSALFFASSFAENVDNALFLDFSECASYERGEEYVMMVSDYGKCDGKTVIENMDEYRQTDRNGTAIDFVCSALPGGGTVELPVWNYKGYKAYDSTGKELAVTTGSNGCIRISIPDSFSGSVFVRFKESLAWRISELVSALALMVLFVYFIAYRRRTKRLDCISVV